MNHELLDVQAGFRKGRRNETRQIANIPWIIKEATEFQKNIFCFIDYTKAFDCVYDNKLKIFSRNGNSRPPDLLPKKPVWRSRSNI